MTPFHLRRKLTISRAPASSSQSVDASGLPCFILFLLLTISGQWLRGLIYEIVGFQTHSGLQAVDYFPPSHWPCCSAPSWAACAGLPGMPPSFRTSAIPRCACIEGLIGLIGLAVVWGMPLVDNISPVVATVGHCRAGGSQRGLLASSALLMGATLPTIARWIKANPDGVSGSTSSTAAISPTLCSAMHLTDSRCVSITRRPLMWRWRSTDAASSVLPVTIARVGSQSLMDADYCPARDANALIARRHFRSNSGAMTKWFGPLILSLMLGGTNALFDHPRGL